MERFLLRGMMLRGIRGATTVEKDEPRLIVAATKDLLLDILEQNQISNHDLIASVFFTTTPDLQSAFPAEAGRQIGLNDVALICSREIPVPGSLEKTIRVLMHVNSVKKQSEIKHVYHNKSKRLRPDL